MLITRGQLRRWMREAADMGSSVMLDSDIQLHLSDLRGQGFSAANILDGLRNDVYDDSGRATLANWLEAQPVANPWPLLQNWLDHLGPEEAEDDLRMLLMAIAADKAGDRDPHPVEDQEQEREWRAGRWRELRLRVADVPEDHPGLQGFKDQLEALRDIVGSEKDNAMGDLEDALINAGLNESTVMTAKQLRQFIKEGLDPAHDRAEDAWLEIKDGEDKLRGALAKLEELGREDGHYLSPLSMLKNRILVMIGELLDKVDNANQQAEKMLAMGGDVASKISQHFGTKKMAKKFVERVEEVGFEQAAVDFNLGADAQFEVGTAMGEYEEKQ